MNVADCCQVRPRGNIVQNAHNRLLQHGSDLDQNLKRSLG
ncbi:hypothetical protein V1293_001417 [Bradyrhizobium sp. AZCC 1693]